MSPAFEFCGALALIAHRLSGERMARRKAAKKYYVAGVKHICDRFRLRKPEVLCRKAKSNEECSLSRNVFAAFCAVGDSQTPNYRSSLEHRQLSCDPGLQNNPIDDLLKALATLTERVPRFALHVCTNGAQFPVSDFTYLLLCIISIV